MIQLKPLSQWGDKKFKFRTKDFTYINSIGFICQQDGYEFHIVNCDEYFMYDCNGWSAICKSAHGTFFVAQHCLSFRDAYRALYKYIEQYALEPDTIENKIKCERLLKRYQKITAEYQQLLNAGTEGYIICPYCNQQLPAADSVVLYCPHCHKNVRSEEISKQLQKYQDELVGIVIDIHKYNPFWQG